MWNSCGDGEACPLDRWHGMKAAPILRRQQRRMDKKTAKKRLHILVISQYFHPETFRINNMAAEWVKRGYKVTVLTGIPNYPMGKFFDGYGYFHRRREKWNGVEVIRIPIVPRGSCSIGMAANYISFVLSGWWWMVSNNVHADLVFTYEVSPMTQALIGCWYARKYHIPHFLYVQDLWPENVEAVTGIRNPLVINPINSMVDYIYKHTDQIFTTSQSFADAIINRKVPVGKRKVHYWPQYAEEFSKPLKRKRIPDDGIFYIVFTGNIGKAQGLDILPKAAEKFSNSNIRFVIVGDGRYQKQFEAEIKKRGVADRFIMVPRQPAEVVPSILSCCDAAFLSFADTPLWKKTIPAKLQSYMACGMPIIAAAKGETRRIINEAGCGICCDIGDSSALVKAIQEMLKTDLVNMGKNSRAYCERFFDKNKLMDQMDKYIAFEIQRDIRGVNQ